MTREFLKENREESLKTIPLDRFGITDDMAAAALFLASKAGNWVTGIALTVDGGSVLHVNKEGAKLLSMM